MIPSGIARLERLRRSLRDALGVDSLLFHRLDRALASHDSIALDVAMSILELYPEPVRAKVEAVVSTWFEQEPEPIPVDRYALPDS